MTLQEVVIDKMEVLDKCYDLIREAIEADPNYALSDIEMPELIYDMLAEYGKVN